MDCNDWQSRICELLDSGQNARSDPVLDQHLAECHTCRKFHDIWAGIDAQLARQAVATALPADFHATLLARLPARPPRLTPAQIATRREQFERAYGEAMDALTRRYLFPHPVTVLRLLAVATACVFAGILLTEATKALPVALEAALGQARAGWAIPMLCCLIGLAALLYHRHRRWRAALHRLILWRPHQFRFVP